MRFLRLLLTALATLVLALFVGSNGPASAQPPCGIVTTNIRLMGDCAGVMSIQASNIVVNLNGFTVTGGLNTAIQIPNQTNVKLMNGTVTGGAIFNLFISGGGNHTIRNLTISSSGNHGIIVSASGNRILNNVIESNPGQGIGLVGGDNVIANNQVNNNGVVGIFAQLGS